MTDQTPHRDTAPFVMFQNGLEMFGRVVESSCKWSIDVLEAMEKAAREAATEASDTPEQPKAMSVNMIPETGDLQSSAAAVAAAMSDSARRRMDIVDAAQDEPVESVREAIARAKSSISAVKTPKAG